MAQDDGSTSNVTQKCAEAVKRIELEHTRRLIRVGFVQLVHGRTISSAHFFSEWDTELDTLKRDGE